MRLASLGSGSRGNATLLEAADTRVLIDCGFSLRELRRRASRMQFDLATLDAVLVTHEHSDHCSGVAALSRAYGLPVYMTHGTWASGRIDECAQLRLFDADAQLSIGAFHIEAVAVPHDAREPVQYVLTCRGSRVGVLTDLGSITPHVRASFGACDALILEFNHDRQMLADGPYPPALKRRVGGDWGHLSNSQAMALLADLNGERLEHLVVAHTSEKNNSRERILALVRQEQPQLLSKLVWAEQERGFAWLGVSTSLTDEQDGVERPSLVSDASIGAY